MIHDQHTASKPRNDLVNAGHSMEYAGHPVLPGYVSIKETAHILGISQKRVYDYVEQGRLPALWAAHVLVLPLEDVHRFQRRSPGRPRTSNPVWRISSEENTQYVTSITVQIRTDQQQTLLTTLAEIKQREHHLFPGTIHRWITENKETPGQIQISLVWRRSIMPSRADREQALETFRQTLHEVLDWNTAHYSDWQVLMHT